MRKIKILFICHGNICRSTMAQSIFTYLVHRQHLDAVFEIDSAATSREEIGNPPHYGTKNKLYEEHIPLIPHRARQMTRDDYLYYDLLIGMDTANIRNMTRMQVAVTVSRRYLRCCHLLITGQIISLQQRAMLQIHGIQVILMRPLMM